jgi:hypothetical protein
VNNRIMPGDLFLVKARDSRAGRWNPDQKIQIGNDHFLKDPTTNGLMIYRAEKVNYDSIGDERILSMRSWISIEICVKIVDKKVNDILLDLENLVRNKKWLA